MHAFSQKKIFTKDFLMASKRRKTLKMLDKAKCHAKINEATGA